MKPNRAEQRGRTSSQLRLIDELDGPLARDRGDHACSPLRSKRSLRTTASTATTTPPRPKATTASLLYTLVDFLRLRTAYDRIAWRLQAGSSSHTTSSSAKTAPPRRSSGGAIGRPNERPNAADQFNEALHRALPKQYGMRLPSDRRAAGRSGSSARWRSTGCGRSSAPRWRPFPPRTRERKPERARRGRTKINPVMAVMDRGA